MNIPWTIETAAAVRLVMQDLKVFPENRKNAPLYRAAATYDATGKEANRVYRLVDLFINKDREHV